MESIGEVLATNWSGSQKTAQLVRQQILERFGPEAAEQYKPESNTMTYREALKRGYKVIKGQRSLKSITFVEKEESNGATIRIPRTVHLFFVPLQCEKVN